MHTIKAVMVATLAGRAGSLRVRRCRERGSRSSGRERVGCSRARVAAPRREREPDRLAAVGGAVPAGRAQRADQQQPAAVLLPGVGLGAGRGPGQIRPAGPGRRRGPPPGSPSAAAPPPALWGRPASVCSTALATSSAVSSSAVSLSADASMSASAVRIRARAIGTAAVGVRQGDAPGGGAGGFEQVRGSVRRCEAWSCCQPYEGTKRARQGAGARPGHGTCATAADGTFVRIQVGRPRCVSRTRDGSHV